MADYSFSTGMQGFKMNGSVLRVNLSDNNLYKRFLAMLDDMENLEAEFVERTKGFSGKLDLKGFPMRQDEKGEDEIDVESLDDAQQKSLLGNTEAIVDINYDIDRRVKEKLTEVFGASNDFDAIFQGVNVMAFDEHGNRILTNFFNVITPLIKKALKVTDGEVNTLVGNRTQRRKRNNHK